MRATACSRRCWRVLGGPPPRSARAWSSAGISTALPPPRPPPARSEPPNRPRPPATRAYAVARGGAPPGRGARRVAALVDRVGLTALARGRARGVWGAEEQGVARGRPLARDPKTLVLDEPTANLDPAATRGVEA